MSVTLGRFIARCIEEHRCQLLELQPEFEVEGTTARYLLRTDHRAHWAVLPNLDDAEALTPDVCWSLCNRLGIRS